MSKIVDCIIGDAMGVPTEFCDRNELLKHPITQMIGYGSHDVPSLTHAHEISKLGCNIYNFYIINLLKGLDKFEAYSSIKKENYDAYTNDTIKEYSRILENDISKLHIDDISSSGYVVCTLECALWIFLIQIILRIALLYQPTLEMTQIQWGR